MDTNRRAVLAGLGCAPWTAWRLTQEDRAEDRVDAFLRGHVAREVFSPLGITHAAYGDHRSLVPGRNATTHTRQFGPLPPR